MENRPPIPQKRSRILEPYPLEIYAEYAALLQPNDVDLLIKKRRRITAAIIIQYHVRKLVKRRDGVRQQHHIIVRRKFLLRWYDKTVASRLREEAYRAAERQVKECLLTLIAQRALRSAKLERERREYLERKNAIETIIRSATTFFVLDMFTESLREARAAAEARRLKRLAEEASARAEAERIAIMEAAARKEAERITREAEMEEVHVLEATAVIVEDEDDQDSSLILSPFGETTVIQSPIPLETSLITSVEPTMEVTANNTLVQDEEDVIIYAAAVVVVEEQETLNQSITDLAVEAPVERAPNVSIDPIESKVSRQVTEASSKKTQEESNLSKKAKSFMGKVSGYFSSDDDSKSEKPSRFRKARDSASSLMKRAKAAVSSSEDDSTAQRRPPDTPSESGSAMGFLKNLVSRRASNASSQPPEPVVTFTVEPDVVAESDISTSSTPRKIVGMMASVASSLKEGMKRISKPATQKLLSNSESGPRSGRVRARCVSAESSSEYEEETPVSAAIAKNPNAKLSAEEILAGRRILFHMRCLVRKLKTARLRTKILLYLVVRLQAVFRARQVRKRFKEEMQKHKQMMKLRQEVTEYHKTHDKIPVKTKRKKALVKVERKVEESSDEPVGVEPQLVEPLDATVTPPDSPGESSQPISKNEETGAATEPRRRRRQQNRQSGVTGSVSSEPMHADDFGEEETQSANVLKSITRGFISQERLIRMNKLSLINQVATVTASAVGSVGAESEPAGTGADQVEIEPMDLYFPQDVRGVLSGGVVVDEASPLIGAPLAETSPQDWKVKEVSEVEVYELEHHQLNRNASRIQRAFRRYMTKRKFLAYLTDKDVETVRSEEKQSIAAEQTGDQPGETAAAAAPAAGTDTVNAEACVVM